MKIIINDDVNMIIFLNKGYLKLDLNDDVEQTFKKLFLILKNVYNIKINGFYNINVYNDNNYGSILELQEEELEFIEYYDNNVDMRVNVHDVNYLYRFDDYFVAKQFNLEIFIYKKEIYGKINKQISDIELSRILENSEIVYKDTDKILKYGKRLGVKYEKGSCSTSWETQCR